MMLLETTVHDKLAAKLNNIDTSAFVLKTKCDADKSELETKFLILSGLLKRQIIILKLVNQKIKYQALGVQQTNSALTAVENKIFDISSLVKKTDYNTNITEIENKPTDHNHDKYITNPEFNRLAAENFAARLKQGNVVTMTEF